jgi:hypothetical protein
MKALIPALVVLTVLGVHAAQQGGPAGRTGAPAATTASPLDFAYFKEKVQPIFLKKKPGHARCVVCHETGTPRLQALNEGATTWTDEQSRQNFTAWQRVVSPGNPMTSRLLLHPLSKEAGGDHFHGGGKHWESQNDPDFQTIAAWIRGATLSSPASPSR